MDILAERIRERRLALGMSQGELAEKVGYTSRASINKIEKGLVDVPRSKVLAIAKALGVSPTWLLGIDFIPEPIEHVPLDVEALNAVAQAVDDRYSALFNTLEGITPEELEKVKTFIEFLKSQREQ